MPWQFHEDVAMSMKRVRDMADPILAQDAATRKWTEDLVGTGGGGGGANEVVIQEEIPTDPALELWVDYLSNADGSGSDEVFIQNDEPTEITAELWLDLDEPYVADAGLAATVAALAAEVARLRVEIDALKGEG